MSPVNPFVWDRPLDPSRAVSREKFTREVAMGLKGQMSNVLINYRGTGKSTFTFQLAQELMLNHGLDAPPFQTLRVDLDSAFSLKAANVCLYEALRNHYNPAIQREARKQLSVLSTETGVDLKRLKRNTKQLMPAPEDIQEIFSRLLDIIPRLENRIIVIFDEFQRLNDWNVENRKVALAEIRSTLLRSTTQDTAVLFTGSLRKGLQLVLGNDEYPIWNQTHRITLPEIAEYEFLEYLNLNFEATGKMVKEEALEYLLQLSRRHPKRTQQLAHAVWGDAVNGEITTEVVNASYQHLIEGNASDFAATVNELKTSGNVGVKMWKVLYMITERGGKELLSPALAEDYELGKGGHKNTKNALEGLERKALVEERDGIWYIVDPFLEAWLKVHSPFSE